MSLISSKLRMAGIIGGALIAGGVMGGAAVAYQPHMYAALHHLEAAQAQLQVALPDKGGYRDRAISDIGQAISDVQAGIAAGAP